MQKYNDFEFINIGTGKDITIRELVNLIKKMVKFDGKVKYDKTKPNGMMRKLVDSSKIDKLGWKPKTSLKSGLKYTIDWYNNNYEQ